MVIPYDMCKYIAWYLTPFSYINIIPVSKQWRRLQKEESICKFVTCKYFGKWSLDRLDVETWYAALVKLVTLQNSGLYNMVMNRNGNVVINCEPGFNTTINVPIEDSSYFPKRREFTYQICVKNKYMVIKLRLPFEPYNYDTVRFLWTSEIPPYFVLSKNTMYGERNFLVNHELAKDRNIVILPELSSWPYLDIETFRTKSTTDTYINVYFFLVVSEYIFIESKDKVNWYEHKLVPGIKIGFDISFSKLFRLYNGKHFLPKISIKIKGDRYFLRR